MWTLTEKELPAPYKLVLVYTVNEEITTGYWIDRNDLAKGRMWSIAGRSGGIGTKIEVKPPLYWMSLPKPPE